MTNGVWVEPTALEGVRVRLEPLEMRHAAGLARIADESLFRFFAAYKPDGRDEISGQAFVENVNGEANKVAFAIIDKTSGHEVGSTSYMDIKPKHRGLEIGSTWLEEAAQGSDINPECKLLLLEHAFEDLGAVRVQFRTDLRNLKSQRAIEKLGASREGIFRQDTIMPDGFLRDTVFYSLLAAEWPAAKDRLIARLAGLRDHAEAK